MYPSMRDNNNLSIIQSRVNKNISFSIILCLKISLAKYLSADSSIWETDTAHSREDNTMRNSQRDTQQEPCVRWVIYTKKTDINWFLPKPTYKERYLSSKSIQYGSITNQGSFQPRPLRKESYTNKGLIALAWCTTYNTTYKNKANLSIDSLYTNYSVSMWQVL